MRRVIRRERHRIFLGRQASRQTAHVTSGEVMTAVARPSVLGVSRPGDVWPERVFLLERPEEFRFEFLEAGFLLTEAWRRLFRLEARERIRRRFRDSDRAAEELIRRVERIGRTEFEEAQHVLHEDGWLFDPGDLLESYALFAAHFLELTHFAPALLRPTFPAIEDPREVEAIVVEDVDPADVLTCTRLPGAPLKPENDTPDEPVEESAVEPEDDDAPPGEEPGSRDRLLALAARDASERGNLVRSAIRWTRVAAQSEHLRGGGRAERSEARAALRGLARRLRAALGFPEYEENVWAEALAPLLSRAADEAWSPEELFLYDLQRICVEHERPPYRIDLVGWVASLGRRPLRHDLPRLQQVAAVGRLRRASHRLSKIRIRRDDRARLEAVVKAATSRAEKALRDDLRPQIASVLDQTWVAPANLPERVAASKTVEELLDRIVENGRSALGDLRDSASASDLKMPDMDGPGEFWDGGKLLETDRALAASLDGVHRRGEVYLRGLQRLSMLAFGTNVGRLFTLYVALPFGGAFVALEGIQHLVGPLVHLVSGVDPPFNNRFSVLVVGLVATLLINSGAFRSAMGRALGRIGTAVRVLLLDWPTRLIFAPWIRRVLGLRLLVLIRQCLVWPGLAAGAAWGLFRLLGFGTSGAAGAAAGAFAASNLLFNTTPGQAVLERLNDAFARGWRAVWHDLVPGLFRLVMEVFEAFVASVERAFYTVDEWLRFRRGEARLSFLSKALVGPVWFVVVYLARIYIIVLIEPQVNPIKHFPVVTVSHKVILPMTLQITRVLEAPLAPVVGGGAAAAVAWTTVFLLPGMFGFLVWELKSNWRLYRANRAKSLGPVSVGSHGESVVRLLRPGFHSGTLPRTFAGLRRARRRTWVDPSRSRSEKNALHRREALHHVEEALRRLVERELLALLRGSRGLGGSVLILGETVLATNRVRLELIRQEPGRDETSPLVIDVEERSGRLVAGVQGPGWLDRLTPEERATLAAALAGLFKKCGVELVQAPGEVVPDPSALNLAAVALTWDSWVERWFLDASDPPPDRPLIELPGVTAADPEPSGMTRLG